MILRAAALQPPVCWQEPGCTGVQSGFMLGEKVRQFAREYCYIDVTSGRQTLWMTEIQTSRVHRTWFDKLLLRQRAYQTKIFDEHREVLGRGPTPEASQEAAERRWVAELPTKDE